MYIVTSFEALGYDLAELGIEKITPELADQEDIMDALRHYIFRAIELAYLDETTESDWYLYRSYVKDQFIFGGINPDAFIADVKNWNQEIFNALKPALMAAGILDKDGRYTPDKVQMDTTNTYAAKKAMREIDNDWFPAADHAVYLNNENGLPWFTVQLKEKDISDICLHPENYLIIEVYPK